MFPPPPRLSRGPQIGRGGAADERGAVRPQIEGSCPPRGRGFGQMRMTIAIGHDVVARGAIHRTNSSTATIMPINIIVMTPTTYSPRGSCRGWPPGEGSSRSPSSPGAETG